MDVRSFLFRRMTIDNKNYYQFYKVDDDFTITNEFSDFPNRNEKEFFYIEDTGAMPLSEDNLYMLFTENNNKLDPLTDPELFVNVLKVRLGEKNLAEKVEELDKVVNKIIDIDSMTAEEYKKYLTNEFGTRGQKEIFEGIDIELTDGTVARFTYNFEDQLNLLSALYTVMLVQDLTTLIPYHSHHNPCKLYLAADIVKIYMGLQANSIQKQTRVNMLNNWIRSLNNKEEMLEIKYDSKLPQSYQEQY